MFSNVCLIAYKHLSCSLTIVFVCVFCSDHSERAGASVRVAAEGVASDGGPN